VRVAVGQIQLAEVRGAITRLFQKTRQRGCLRIQPVGHAAFMILCRRGEMLMNGIPRRIIPGHHRRATRRAHRIEHIELLEVEALAREPVKFWRFQPRMPVAR